ncbi:MAG: alpha/beta hydrolase family protein [Sodaliphilus sp.]
MMKICVLALMAVVACFCGKAADFVGEWSGNLSVGAVSLKLVFHIDRDGDALAGTLDSPMQKAFGIACTPAVKGDSLVVDIPAVGGAYKGVMQADGTIAGEFSQMGQSMPLALKRVVKEVVAPKPYIEKEVTVDAGGGITLAGTFSIPKGGGPFPAVVLLTGSGAQDRNETIGDHRPFAVIADSLTRHGIAVLRCDDRGVGGSSIASGYETTADFAADAMAMLHAVKQYEGVDPNRVGFIGHSEGGLIAIINATKGPRFIVTLAAPAVKGKELMIRQNELVAKVNGFEVPEETRATMNAVFSAIDTIPHVNALRDRLKQLLADLPAHVRDAELPVFTSAWYRHFIQFDPTDALIALGQNKKIAMLALNGEMDAQVDVDQNLTMIQRLVPQAQIRRMPGLNHAFQPVESWAKSLDIVANPHSFSPEAIEHIITFIHGVR